MLSVLVVSKQTEVGRANGYNEEPRNKGQSCFETIHSQGNYLRPVEARAHKGRHGSF